ncbi:MAG: SAP domain-containing protein [Allorhizobium sp.]
MEASVAHQTDEKTLSQKEAEVAALTGDVLTPDSLTSMTNVQLRDELRRRGLKVSGVKAALIERLRSHLGEE